MKSVRGKKKSLFIRFCIFAFAAYVVVSLITLQMEISSKDVYKRQGDTLFAGDIGRIDLYGGDYPSMLASLKKLAALPGDYRVLPGHGPESTLERERRHNPYMSGAAHDGLY